MSKNAQNTNHFNINNIMQQSNTFIDV